MDTKLNASADQIISVGKIICFRNTSLMQPFSSYAFQLRLNPSLIMASHIIIISSILEHLKCAI